MANDDGNREERIARLKAEAAAMAGGRMVAHDDEDVQPELREQFWQKVVALETAATTDLTKELAAIGVPLLEPEGLDDAAVYAALWTVIDGLATLGVFLDQTDHLSDRELYTQLLRETLPEEMDALGEDGRTAVHIDVLGYHQPELYVKYYADERAREAFRPFFPDGLPDHEDPPYDRDSRLPVPWWMTS